MPSSLRRHDEAGHVHFWTLSTVRRLGFFHHDDMKQIVIDGLSLLQTKFGIALLGYVVMPDHVHVLLYPHPRGQTHIIPISKLLNAFKQHVGFYGKKHLRTLWREQGSLWSVPLNSWAQSAHACQPLWNTRGYDFNVTNEETLRAKLDYCHKNPVTRGLVERPEDWPWSSFRFYECGDQTLLAVDWGGRWPMEW